MNSADVAYCEIESVYGHDAFLLPCRLREEMVTGFLAANLRGNGIQVPAKGNC